MSAFFRSPGESSSSSSSEDDSPDSKHSEVSPRVPRTILEGSSSTHSVPSRHVPSLLEHQAARSSKHRAELLAHALLEEKSRVETADELNRDPENIGRIYNKNDKEVIALAQDRYKYLVQQLGEANVLSSTYGQRTSGAAREGARQGLDAISQIHSTRIGDSGGMSRPRKALKHKQNLLATMVGLDNMAISPVGSQPSSPQFAGAGKARRVVEYQSFSPLGRPILDSSRYLSEFREICLLGKGGYGKVYRALHRLEECEYAIKKIPLQTEHLKGQGTIDELLHEMRTLARLEHVNIVRYYSGWLEYTVDHNSNVSPIAQYPGRRLLTNGPIDNISSNITDTTTTGFLHHMDANTADDESLDIVFEASNSEQKSMRPEDSHLVKVYTLESGSIQNQGMARRPSRTTVHTVSSTSLRKDSESNSHMYDEEISSDAEPNIGESGLSRQLAPAFDYQPRSAMRPAMVAETTSGIDQSESSILPVTLIPHPSMPPFTLHIQMSVYPLTMAEFISERRETGSQSTDAGSLRHCFHTECAARLLLKILDGVQYLHRKGIVHRDLKPNNIFLSIYDEDIARGCVNLSNCIEYDKQEGVKKPVYLNARIGDFGLVAPCTVGNARLSDDTSKTCQAVGTEFYRPPESSSVVSEKLDVYALGIVLLELLCHFNTRSERIRTLSEVKRGILPELLWLEAGVRECLEGMLRPSEDKRLTCSDVRRRLEQFLGIT